MSKNYRVGNIEEIGPLKDSFMKGWHSVRHYLGVEAFGINAVTVNKGEYLVKQHNEVASGQQEVFIVMKGKASFEIDGENVDLGFGDAVNIEPAAVRSAIATDSPTTVLIIGAKEGEAYQPPRWDKE